MEYFPNNQPCPHCGRYANRGVTVDAIIINNSKVLLIKRGSEPYKGFWALPGGYVEWDETLENAITREVKEEVGVKVLSLKQLGVYSKPSRHPNQAFAVAFSVEIEGEPIAGDDAMELKFVDINDLPEELAFDHKKIIEDYLKSD